MPSSTGESERHSERRRRRGQRLGGVQTARRKAEVITQVIRMRPDDHCEA